MLKRVLQLLAIAVLSVGVAWAAENPFIGEWKLDSSRSRTPDEMKVESKGGNTYIFNFGGGEETIVADGTDQPGLRGTMLSVKPDGPDWIVERKQNGRLMLRATWKLSEDGSTLTDYYREFHTDGTTLSLDYVYLRNGGGTGFAADWKSIRETRNSPPLILEVKAYEADGLSFGFADDHDRKNVKLDGKDYPQGSDPAKSFVSSVRQVDQHTLEMTDKQGGNVLDTQEISLSSDGRTLTMTMNRPGRTEQVKLVFERQ